jgi:hypothetical protein
VVFCTEVAEQPVVFLENVGIVGGASMSNVEVGACMLR